MMIVIDYGATNVRSIVRALEGFGDVTMTGDPEEVINANGVILPGVGAFGPAMQSLKENGLDEAIREYIQSGRPFLGICLGMQLLFDESEEMGVHKGLGIFKGKVRRFAEGEKVPHIGWNEVNCKPSALWNGLPDHYFYFVHSYHVEPREDIVIGLTNYGYDFVSAVQKDNVFGVQFHPEKSQKSGQVILRNFLRFC